MSIILLSSLYIMPLLFIICMVVFRYSFTLQQVGLITQFFTIIPGIVGLLKIFRKFRTEGNQSIIDLRNCFSRHNHENITKWFDKNQYGLERFFNASIIFIATSAFVAGLIMQLLATY